MDKNVVRVLSSSVVVSSLLFAKLSASKQTEILANTNGKPLLFVDSFGAFTNKKRIIDRLLAGEDVSVELEFNEISLTSEEITALKLVRPVIEKIRGAKGTGYQRVETDKSVDELLQGWNFSNMNGGGANPTFYNPNGWPFTKNQAEKVFQNATKQWHTGEKAPSFRIQIRYDNRTVTITENEVKVGCQSFSRAQVEAVGEKLGFAFPE